MDGRSHVSPMDWEYPDRGPMDPSSPFAQSTGNMQGKNPSIPSSFGTFGQNSFGRTYSSPSKPLPPTPIRPASLFPASQLQRTTTAPPTARPFRNPAFTTPRKPFDADMFSEASPAESSPAATDVSDSQETPDHDRSYNLGQMTITPASMSKSRSSAIKKSGKGEIAIPFFANREKVRKRKRRDGDKDLSGYKLPYLQTDEWEHSDYESDESTFQPNKPQIGEKKKHPRNAEGWFGGFLAAIQRHPYAPSILGYWLQFAFNLVCVTGTVWIGWAIVAGLRNDFATARQGVQNKIKDEIGQCQYQFTENKCHPVEQRLPAMHDLCEQWFQCINQDPNNVRNVQLGAKGIIEIVNEIVDTMSYKTIGLFLVLFVIFLFSGRSLYKNAHGLPDYYPGHGTATAFGHEAREPQGSGHPQHVYWQALEARTPRHQLNNARHFLAAHEETPETDASPPRSRMKAITAPQTPGTRRSPTKGEQQRERSPTKSRSPTKRY